MEENKFIEFFKQHSYKIIGIFVALIAGILFVERLQTSKNGKQRKDFYVMQQIATRCYKGEPISLESINDAEAILKRQPQLHPKYDHLLTLSLFQLENASKSIAYGQNSLKRVSSMASAKYQESSRIALLVAEHKYQEALGRSLELESELKKEEIDNYLRAFNLVRLIALAKELHQNETYHVALSQLEKLKAFAEIAPLFESKTFTWKDFINLEKKSV